MFNFYKNILELSKTRVHSEMKVYTTEFINYLSLIIATKVKNNLIRLKSSSKLLIQTDYRIFEKLQSWSNKWYRMKKTQGVEICSRPCGIVRNIALH